MSDTTYFGNRNEYRVMKGTDNGVKSICIEMRPVNSYPTDPWHEMFMIDCDVFWALSEEARQIYAEMLEESEQEQEQANAS